MMSSRDDDEKKKMMMMTFLLLLYWQTPDDIHARTQRMHMTMPPHSCASECHLQCIQKTVTRKKRVLEYYYRNIRSDDYYGSLILPRILPPTIRIGVSSLEERAKRKDQQLQ